MQTYVEIPSLYDSSLTKSSKKGNPANLEQEIFSDFKFSGLRFSEGLVATDCNVTIWENKAVSKGKKNLSFHTN